MESATVYRPRVASRAPATATILLADDDPGILSIVTRLLQIEGFVVITCENGRKAMALAEQLSPSLLILDVIMPELSGMEVCESLRAKSDVPIIMLTVLDDESDAARALEAGADDYIRKPFGARELVARTKAVLRRARSEMLPERVNLGSLDIDGGQRTALVDGEDLALSRTEFNLLFYLARNPNRVLTHNQILERVWGAEYLGANHVVRLTVHRLRQKLPGSGLTLETLNGVGYRLRAGSTSYSMQAMSA